MEQGWATFPERPSPIPWLSSPHIKPPFEAFDEIHALVLNGDDQRWRVLLWYTQNIMMFAARHAQVRIQMSHIFIRVHTEGYFLNTSWHKCALAVRPNDRPYN